MNHNLRSAMNTKLFGLSASILFLGSSVLAQTTYTWSPPNTGKISGGTNNTIPFWGKSATYQQIHEKETMGSILTMKGMGFRPAGNRTVTGRSWDMRLILSHTNVTAANPSPNFSTNLGSVSTTIVYGSATSWPTFTWQSFTTNGFTPAFTIPFKSPYIYLSGLGNLCWEWRHKNGTSNVGMAMDATFAINQKGTTLSSTGTGCTATGKTGSATATMMSVQTTTSAYQRHLEIRLSNAANNANSMMALSMSNATGAIGWCAPVVTPLILLPMKTDSTGSFLLKENLVRLSGSSTFSVYTQFGFSDTGLPGALGLSNVAGFRTPAVPGAHGMCRVYRYDRSANGAETALTGTGSTPGFGLSTAWLQ